MYDLYTEAITLDPYRPFAFYKPFARSALKCNIREVYFCAVGRWSRKAGRQVRTVPSAMLTSVSPCQTVRFCRFRDGINIKVS